MCDGNTDVYLTVPNATVKEYLDRYDIELVAKGNQVTSTVFPHYWSYERINRSDFVTVKVFDDRKIHRLTICYKPSTKKSIWIITGRTVHQRAIYRMELHADIMREIEMCAALTRTTRAIATREIEK